mmetsp:Transcript_5111/g.6649  ORF Transcript_5111/g.6649 Transcript_5111/m.6649 type:complete len:123 (-) Transcript_5111:66-434(-)
MNIEEVAQNAERAMRDFKSMVQGGSGSGKDSDKLYDAWEKAATRAQHSLEGYRLELRNLPPEEQDKHKPRLKDLEDSLRDSRKEMGWKKRQAKIQAQQSPLHHQARPGHDPTVPLVHPSVQE